MEKVFYFNPEKPVIAKDKKPYKEGGRVVTIQPSKEFQVMYSTNHTDKDIQAIYEEFKMYDNKLFWLSENRKRLEKYSINVDNLIEAHKKDNK